MKPALAPDPQTISPPKSGCRGPGIIFASFAGLALLVAVAVAAFYLITVHPVRSMGNRVAEALSRITGGTVAVSGSTAVLRDDEVSELAVVSRKMQSVVKYESDVLGSENVLIVKGQFDVKAGYRLDDPAHPARLAFDTMSGTVATDFPEAKVLSVELIKYDVLYSKQGLWNRLSADDQQYVTNLLLLQARKDAQASDLREEAAMRLSTRLEDLLSGTGTQLDAPVLP